MVKWSRARRSVSGRWTCCEAWPFVLMVLYHLVFDLNYFAVYDIDVSSGFWLAVARAAASLFLLLVGLSLTLSHSRARLLGQEDRFRLRLLKRSAWILGLALGVTLVTYLFIGKGFIVFGVLHLIGLSLLLAYPFLRLQRASIIFGLLFILFGIYLQNIVSAFPAATSSISAPITTRRCSPARSRPPTWQIDRLVYRALRANGRGDRDCGGSEQVKESDEKLFLFKKQNTN